jgi:hypothetical protein
MTNPNGNGVPAYLREADAAKVLCLATGTLQNWRVLGIGPTYLKLGGRIVYAAADLVSWAESQRRTSTSATNPPPAAGAAI